MAKRLLLLLAVFFLAAAPARADFQQQRWQYSKDLTSPKDGFVLIDLDREVLESSRFNLQDIRILNSDGQEVPFQVVRRDPVKEETYPAALIDKTYQKDLLTVTLDVQRENSLHNEINLTVSSKEDYLRDVKVEGSTDNKSWALIARGKIASVSSNFRRDVISYNPVSFKYIRLSIENSEKAPLEVTGARVRFIPRQDSYTERELQSGLVSVKTDKADRITEVIIDLGAKGFFAGKVFLQNNLKNFNRQVRYYDSLDGVKWNELGSDSIYHYKWADYESSKNTVTINRYCGRYIKLEINNQDSQPLPIEGVKVYGDSPRLLAELGRGAFTLWYGSPGAKEPSYDLSRFSHLIDRAGLEVINPGPEKVNSGYSPGVSGLTEKYPWLLNLITVLCAFTVGLLIFKNLKSKSA